MRGGDKSLFNMFNQYLNIFSIVVKSMGPGDRVLGNESQLCHLSAVCSWATSFTSLCLSFLSLKWGHNGNCLEGSSEE